MDKQEAAADFLQIDLDQYSAQASLIGASHIKVLDELYGVDAHTATERDMFGMMADTMAIHMMLALRLADECKLWEKYYIYLVADNQIAKELSLRGQLEAMGSVPPTLLRWEKGGAFSKHENEVFADAAMVTHKILLITVLGAGYDFSRHAASLIKARENQPKQENQQ